MNDGSPRMPGLDGVLVDPETRRVFVGQAERRISPKAAAVLLALGETPGQVWSRDALLERVWPGVHVGEEVLTHAIAELRRALSDDFRRPRFLETVHKSGYRLLKRFERCGAPRQHGNHDQDISLQAFADFLAACDYFELGGRHNTHLAIELLSSVIDTAPDFALAHAELSKVLAFMALYYEPRHANFELAQQHCATAHRIKPGLPQAHAAEGLIHAASGNLARSAKSFAAALASDPHSSDTYYLLGRACLTELSFDRVAIMFEHAARLRPDDFHSLFLAGKMRQGAGDRPGALADFRAALPRVEQALASHPQSLRALCGKARCLLELERQAEARALMDEIAEHPDPMNYHLACTYARAGYVDRALDVLEQVVELGWRHGAWLMRDPDFDAIRSEPRYQRIAASL
ncbi:MAG: TPR end-of-group domain-containing protein [Caulobacteraceae bacterium]